MAPVVYGHCGKEYCFHDVREPVTCLMERVRFILELERAGSIFLNRRAIIHRFTINKSKVCFFQIQTGNTLEGLRVMEIAQKIPHDLIVGQVAKEHTVSCQLLYKWRLSYV